MFIISGPAGTGKTTLITKFIQEHDHCIRIVTTTTRPPRLGEQEGKDYHFVNEQTFQEKIQRGEFLEYARVFDAYYGSSRGEVLKRLEENYHVFLVIDTQGASSIQEENAIFIFIAPPSIEELTRRLKNRKDTSSSAIQKRTAFAQYEIDQAKNYDYIIINDDFNTAYETLCSIVDQEIKGRI